MPPRTEGVISQSLAEAVSALRRGDLIGLPTETVYGLAADALNEEAVAKIFQVKGRPTNHPLILHIGDVCWLPRFCSGNIARATQLAMAFWPGPLTMVLERNETVPLTVTGGLNTVAVRVPAHPLALAVLKALDRPLAAPSANEFGAVSPTTSQHVARDLGEKIALVLEGGACNIGLESTIVDLTGSEVRILRPGGVCREEIEQVLDCRVLDNDGEGPVVPGSLTAHYSPRAQLVIAPTGELMDVAERLRLKGSHVGVMQLGSSVTAAQPNCDIVLLGKNVVEAAHELYGKMRLLDDRGCDVIVVELPALEGVGYALVDRILRAAADSR